MDNVITEYPAEIATDGEVEEIDSMPKIGVVVDILDVPVNTFRGLDNSEELSFLHIAWD